MGSRVPDSFEKSVPSLVSINSCIDPTGPVVLALARDALDLLSSITLAGEARRRRVIAYAGPDAIGEALLHARLCVLEDGGHRHGHHVLGGRQFRWCAMSSRTEAGIVSITFGAFQS